MENCWVVQIQDVTVRHWATRLLFAAAVLLAGCQRPEADTYSLLPGTALESPIFQRSGTEDGPIIYVVAGIHGDEEAGWRAAEQLKNVSLKAGSLYVLSRANRYGTENNVRKTKEDRDLNRNFPGDREGCDAEQIAAAIYEDIREKQPSLVLDLHEAVEAESGDALGNTLICQSLDSIGDLVLTILSESEQGRLGNGAFTLYGSPPPGSINRIVTEELNIPVITIETFRGEKLDQRIENQLAMVEFILTDYGMK